MNNEQKLFLNFINVLEGSKTMCKALHWGATNLNINDKRGAHLYLDDFLDIISNFQDTIAESCQGILGTFLNISNVKGTSTTKDIEYPTDLVDYLIENSKYFYNSVPKDIIYVGIKSETETFIVNLNKYNYLFKLTQ